MTSLQQRLVKTGGRLIKQARYYWLLLAESYLTRRLFGSMLRRIEAPALASRVGELKTGSDFSDERGGAGKVSEARVERGSVSSFGILRRGKTGPFHGPWKHPALKTRLDLEFRGARVYITRRAKTENGNSG